VSHWQQLFDHAKRAAIPIEVMVELTHHCNFRCRHCYIPDFSAPDRLTTERVLRLLDELAAMGTLVLAFSGGELFLRRDWRALARRARTLGFDLHLLTNGLLVGDADADEIRRLAATVHVSLYSLDEERFEEITRRRGSFRRVRAGIERLRARGVPVVLKMPLMTINAGDVQAVRDYAAAIGATCRVAPTITARKDGDVAPLALRLPLERAYAEIGGPIGGCHPGDLDGPLCAAASRYCVITSSGEVMACNVLPGSGGNVRERPFREVWESSPWLQEVRGIRARDLTVCGGCVRLAYCGRCHAQALVEDGDLYGPSGYARRRADLVDAERAAAAATTG
jgi:radical SAM protein with 4Fe4S-binding SPASM domain